MTAAAGSEALDAVARGFCSPAFHSHRCMHVTHATRYALLDVVSGCVGYAVRLCVWESSDGWLVAWEFCGC